MVPLPPIASSEEEATLERLNDAINMRLFTAVIPPEFTIHVGKYGNPAFKLRSISKFLR